jgi:putative ABC transport system substrate-binding protein
VILAITTPAVAVLKQEAPAIPVVFVAVSDPVGSGFIQSLPRPGGNITGFINLEGSLSGKWVELLKEVVPGLTHVGFMFNPETAPFAEYYLRAFEAAARCLSFKQAAAELGVTPTVAHEADAERAVRAGLAPPAGSSMPDTFTSLHLSGSLRLQRAGCHTPTPTAGEGLITWYDTPSRCAARRAMSIVFRVERGRRLAGSGRPSSSCSLPQDR